MATVQSAAFKSDPVAGLIDTWALSVQQLNYFQAAAGKDAFGEWHSRALETARTLVRDAERIAQDLASQDQYEQMKGRIESWAAENPIDNLLLTRQSTGPLTAAMLGSPGSSVFSSVGSLSDEVSDLSDRLSIYGELLPKQMRCQAALLMTAEAGGTESPLSWTPCPISSPASEIR